jgi:hypothetical protein
VPPAPASSAAADAQATPEAAPAPASAEPTAAPAATEAPADATVSTADADVPPIPAASTTSTTATPSKTTSSSADVELQSKFNRVGVLNQLMKGYAQLKGLIQADTATQAYLTELESHALLPALRADELALYSGDETYIEHPSGAIRPIKETVQAVVASVHALLFGLNHQLKYPKISFTDFRAGDIALFMPVMTENRKIWMAFHASTPYRYLAEVRAVLILLPLLMSAAICTNAHCCYYRSCLSVAFCLHACNFNSCGYKSARFSP